MCLVTGVTVRVKSLNVQDSMHVQDVFQVARVCRVTKLVNILDKDCIRIRCVWLPVCVKSLDIQDSDCIRQCGCWWCLLKSLMHVKSDPEVSADVCFDHQCLNDGGVHSVI